MVDPMISPGPLSRFSIYILAPIKQICALRLVESQLQASLAAARMRSDAATLLAGSLSEAVRAAESRLQSQETAKPHGAGQEAAKLSWKLAACGKDVAQAQDQLLKAKQVIHVYNVSTSQHCFNQTSSIS